MFDTSKNNYTFGRGKVYVSKLAEASGKPVDDNSPAREFRYLGNTPQFALTIESENLDHYSSDFGTREKDASIQLQVNRTATLTCDNIDIRNYEIFYSNSAKLVTQAGGEAIETFENITKGATYVLGITPTNRLGVRAIERSPDKAVVVKSGDKTLVEDFDYAINYEFGSIDVLANGLTLKDGDPLTVTYTAAAVSYYRISTGDAAGFFEMRYEANNAAGAKQTYWFPYVKIQPTGEYTFKSDTWQQMQFKLEILKRGQLAPIYIDNEPMNVA